MNLIRGQDKSFLNLLLTVALSLVLVLLTVLPVPASVPEPVLTGVAATLQEESARQTLATKTPSATAFVTREPSQQPSPTATLYASPTFLPTVSVPNGLVLKVLHPWQNEAGEAFEALIAQFNQSAEGNPYKIVLLAERAQGYEDLALKLGDPDLQADIVLGMGYDLAFADRDGFWANQGGLIPINPCRDAAKVLLEGPLCDGCASAGTELREQRILPILWRPAVLAWNQSWANELGFDQAPLSRSEFWQQASAGLQASLQDWDYENDGTGGLLLSHSAESALAWYAAFDGNFDSAGRANPFDPESLESALTYLKNLFGENRSWNRGYLSAQTYFARRWTLFYEASLEDIPLLEGTLSSLENKDSYRLIAYPNENGQGSLLLEPLAVAVHSSNQARQQAAWSFVRFLLSRESQRQLAELSCLWPVIGPPAQIAPEFAQRYPAWASALSSGPVVQFAPETRIWGVVRLVFKDAVGRVYSLDAQYFGNILQSLNATLEEMEKRYD